MKFGNKLMALLLTGCILLSGGGMKVMATDESGTEINTSGETVTGTDEDEDAADENAAGVDADAEDESEDPAGGYKVDSESIKSSKMPLTEEELEKQMAAQLALEPETNSREGWPQGPDVTADAAIVMEVNTGAILYGKQIDKKEYPASITKIMTAVLALENGDMDTDKVTFSQESIDFLERGDAHIGLTPGEEISLKDAMYGMLLASANEVSYAIAENIGAKLGIGYDGFIDLMTTRAKELGCTNSHFVNANGLHNEEHYVSAHDMAIMGAAAYKYEAFRDIINTPQHTIPETNLVQETRTFQQNHKMIYEGNQYYYENSTGGKTGYTDQARTTLISFAEKNGMQLVCVVLRTRGGLSYTDSAALFDYGFDNFQKISLNSKETSEEISEVQDDAYVVLPKEASFEDVERKLTQTEQGGKAATAEYFYKDALVGKVDVTLSDAYVTKQNEAAEKNVKETAVKEEKDKLPLWAAVLIGILLMLVVIAILFYVHLWREKEKRRRAREKKRREQRRIQRRLQERREREEEERYVNMQKYHQSNRYMGRQSGRYPQDNVSRQQQQYRKTYDHNERINQNRNTKNRKW